MKGNRVNPPLQITLPESVAKNPDLKKAFDDFAFNLFQMWKRTGGGNDYVHENKIRKMFSSAGRESISDMNIGLQNIYSQQSQASEEFNFTQKTEEHNTHINLMHGQKEEPTTELIDEDHTTSGDEVLICDNVLDIEITLNETPEDREQVTIKRINDFTVTYKALVNIDDKLEHKLNAKFDAVKLIYVASKNEWIITG